MSTILSLKQIRELDFKRLPRKPRKVSKMVSTGKTVVFVENQTVYTNRMDNDHLCWPPGSEPWWFEEVWVCLKKLGVLTEETLHEHRQIVKDSADKREKRYAAKTILENAQAAGVVLTISQRKRLEEAAK